MIKNTKNCTFLRNNDSILIEIEYNTKSQK